MGKIIALLLIVRMAGGKLKQLLADVDNCVRVITNRTPNTVKKQLRLGDSIVTLLHYFLRVNNLHTKAECRTVIGQTNKLIALCTSSNNMCYNIPKFVYYKCKLRRRNIYLRVACTRYNLFDTAMVSNSLCRLI